MNCVIINWRDNMKTLNTYTKTTTQENEKNKPIEKFSAGAIQASIWKNDSVINGKTVAFYTITLERSYKDKSDQWKKSTSLRTQDLPKANLVLVKAYEYLTLKTEQED